MIQRFVWFVVTVGIAAAIFGALTATADEFQRQALIGTTAQSQGVLPGGPPPGGGGPPPPPSPTAVPTATATPKPAAPCPPIRQGAPARCYAFARHLGGPPIDGAAAIFDAEQYIPPDWRSGGHGNQTIWMADSVTGDWCEVGWMQGGRDAFGQLSNPYKVYSAFRNGGEGSPIVESPMSFGPGAFGTVHTYQILREYGTNILQTYMDSIAIAVCPGPVPADDMDVGLEYTDENAVNQGVSPYNIMVHGYTDNTWGGWGLGEELNCIIGTGAYLHWVTNHQQFTDSSNVLPHDQGADC